MHSQQSGIHCNVLLHSANCFFIVFCSSSCWLTMFCPVSISQCSGKELICWATSSSVSIDVTLRFSGGETPVFKLTKDHSFFFQVFYFCAVPGIDWCVCEQISSVPVWERGRGVLSVFSYLFTTNSEKILGIFHVYGTKGL